MNWKSGVQFLAGTRDLSSLHSVHTGSGVHPATYTMDTKGTFQRNKQPGCETDHSPPSSAEVRNGGAPSIVIMVWCLIKQRDFSLLIILMMNSFLQMAKIVTVNGLCTPFLE
jgi:hypothetical protein